jgi:hypothetical protein
MAASVALFVSGEVALVDAPRRLSFLARVWHCALVPMLGMESVIDLAAETVGAMKPWTRAYEDISSKPLRAVVARGSAAIRSEVIVTVGALRGDTDTDADLRLCFRGAYHETASRHGSQN